ncbi:sn-glycerol-1-phosphate dehydrogenase [Agrococcus sp. SGAir0287]|uniref:sn-glycerol-1-phosphate dehydrogenase n=1 Tax=Agrococcus sp. SGAir0287 TaxID=2070347 RepID=UPI0010CD4BCA|nr:iron-containing alcohol dehydrogenase [Agrococcus sp. SGAir0287]QCR19882.1 sn-glycerol-1-phosphate dehydrogenase [Agrococcus sp. SGAir0287]
MATPLEHAVARATDTRAIAIGEGALDRVGPIVSDLLPGRAAIVVADGTTWAAAGEATTASLRASGVALAEPLVLPAAPPPYASWDTVEHVREGLRAVDAVAVVVGAGTLGDVVKLASHELGRPYACVATAPSMDGYAAFGASIVRDGYKQTIACPAPIAVVADLDVLAAAPARMLASGVGDLVEKLPGGADWILADAVGVEPIDADVWALVQDPLRGALADPHGMRAGDPAAIAGLVEGLVASGLAMQAYASSRPASGAGHQCSHLWEMEGLGMHDDPPLPHGLKVGLGTVMLTALYEEALRHDLARLDVDAALGAFPSWPEVEARILAEGFSPALLTAALEQSRAKHPAPDVLRHRLETLRDGWPDVAELLRAQLLPASDVERLLDAVGAVTHPAQIGLDPQRFRATYVRAMRIRSRWTLLDALHEAGLLERCVDALFAPDGFWGRRPHPSR